MEDERVTKANFKVLDALRNDFEYYVESIDRTIVEAVFVGGENGLKKSVEVGPKIYNFLREQISEELKSVLERGKKFVSFDAEIRFKKDLLNYLLKI